MPLPFFAYRKQTGILAIATWIIFTCMLIWFEPSFVKNVGLSDSYSPIFILLFASLYWTILSFSGRWKRTLLWSSSTTVLLWLHITKLDSFLNIILLASFVGIWEYYWSLIKNTVKKPI